VGGAVIFIVGYALARAFTRAGRVPKAGTPEVDLRDPSTTTSA
jgi:hypothetical protein